MNIGIREENFNNKNRKMKESGNKLLTAFLVIFIAGYVFFFSSSVWMPIPYEGVTVTPYGTGIEQNDRTVMIDNWTYSEADKKMEITISIEDLSLDGIKSYVWQVRTPQEYLKTKVIIDTPEFVVIHVENIPRRWAELALIMNISPEEQQKNSDFSELRLYTSDLYVNKVEHITEKSLDEYLKVARTDRIASYKNQLAEKMEEKKRIEDGIKVANDKISELEKSLDFKTEEEQETTLNNINAISSERDSMNRELEEVKVDIENLKAKITLQTDIANGKDVSNRAKNLEALDNSEEEEDEDI